MAFSALTKAVAVREALRTIASEGLPGDDPPGVNHPHHGDVLREDNTPYLASKCFPCLFPRGIADPFMNARGRGVSFADCVQHFIRFADRPADDDGTPHLQFASYRTFRCWCLDTEMRKQTFKQSRVFFTQNRDQAQMSVEDVRERLREKVASIIGSMTR